MRYLYKMSIPIAALVLGFSSIPANAQWFGGGPNSRADNRSAAVTASNFATQQSNLRSQINSAVQTGRMSSGTASALISQLNQANAITQGSLGSGNLTNNAANSVLSIFSSVGNSINGGGSGSQFGNPYANSFNPYFNTNVNGSFYGNNYNPYF